MPLARYFSYVGGVLLALLFMLDAYLPKLPVAGRANVHVPVIRIYSNQKWPERIVYDTNLPTIVPVQVANTEVRLPSPPAVADVPTKARGREAFAQLQSAEASKLKVLEPKRREAKPRRERSNATRRAPPPALLVARYQQFGWFGNSIR